MTTKLRPFVHPDFEDPSHDDLGICDPQLHYLHEFTLLGCEGCGEHVYMSAIDVEILPRDGRGMQVFQCPRCRLRAQLEVPSWAVIQ